MSSAEVRIPARDCHCGHVLVPLVDDRGVLLVDRRHLVPLDQEAQVPGQVTCRRSFLSGYRICVSCGAVDQVDLTVFLRRPAAASRG